jgi:hypothetical protein
MRASTGERATRSAGSPSHHLVKTRFPFSDAAGCSQHGWNRVQWRTGIPSHRNGVGTSVPRLLRDLAKKLDGKAQTPAFQAQLGENGCVHSSRARALPQHGIRRLARNALKKLRLPSFERTAGSDFFQGFPWTSPMTYSNQRIGANRFTSIAPVEQPVYKPYEGSGSCRCRVDCAVG